MMICYWLLHRLVVRKKSIHVQHFTQHERFPLPVSTEKYQFGVAWMFLVTYVDTLLQKTQKIAHNQVI